MIEGAQQWAHSNLLCKGKAIMEKFEISYNKLDQLVSVYPHGRGPRPNSHVIGDFPMENTHAEVTEYVDDLKEAILRALATVGQLDLAPFKVVITPFDGPDIVAKESYGPLQHVALEDQVAVGENTTAAAAAMAEDDAEKLDSPAPPGVAKAAEQAEQAEEVKEAVSKPKKKKNTEE